MSASRHGSRLPAPGSRPAGRLRRGGQRSSSSREPGVGGREPALSVEVSRAASGWAPARSDLAAWAAAALGARASGRELSIRLVGPRESRTLNSRYRRRDKATNVLSFPAADDVRSAPLTAPQPLGDLVICPAVLRAEARAQGKSMRAHWAHLVVHGALHLVGYDHERARDAVRMERREIAVLRALGFDNPYRYP